MDRSPYPVTVGDLVYVDGFAGLVPAKLTEVKTDAHGRYAVVRVTADRPGWRAGESTTVGLSRVVRRGAVSVRGGKYRISNDWHFVIDGERVDVFAEVANG